jgi:hypothetical protein
MIAAGIGFGLGAAFCQSLSYLATRHFVHPRGGGTRQLLVLAHVLMGVVSGLLLPWVWPQQSIPWAQPAIRQKYRRAKLYPQTKLLFRVTLGAKLFAIQNRTSGQSLLLAGTMLFEERNYVFRIY